MKKEICMEKDYKDTVRERGHEKEGSEKKERGWKWQNGQTIEVIERKEERQS